MTTIEVQDPETDEVEFASEKESDTELDISLEEITTTVELERLEVRIYPNPVSQVMNVEINEVATIEAIGLYNQTGMKVRSLEINETSRTEVSDLSGGMYLIRILRTDGSIETQKVIIMN